MVRGAIIMFTLSVHLTSINAERLSETLPPQVQFQINLQVPSAPPFRRDEALIIPFSFTIASLPPVVQISLKGQAIFMPRDKDGRKLRDEIMSKKKIPQQVVQAIFNNIIADVIIISRSLGVPPPVPPMRLPQPKKSPEQRYTPVQ